MGIIAGLEPYKSNCWYVLFLGFCCFVCYFVCILFACNMCGKSFFRLESVLLAV